MPSFVRHSKETMRHVLLFISLGTTPLLLGGCALIEGLGDYSFSDDSNAPPGETNTPNETNPTGVDSGNGEACQVNSDCAVPTSAPGDGISPALGASDPRVCVKQTHTCASLLSAECPRYAGDLVDNAIIVGAILGDENGSPRDALEKAAFLAVEEIDSANGAGGLPPTAADGTTRPLVIVGCNASANVVTATHHLVGDLHVPAVIGPVGAEAVVEATQQVTVKGGTLLMTPTSPVSAISNLADDGLTWRATPSDAQRAKLVIEQMNELETLLKTTRSLTTVKLGVVAPSDANGTSARDAITGTLILNGKFITDAANAPNVSLDAHQAGDKDALSGIATKYATTFKPDIVFITSKEQVVDFIVPFEKALTAARAVARPYYVVTDAGKTEELIDIIATAAVPADTRRRIRGVGIKPDTSSAPVLATFGAAYSAKYSAEPIASIIPSAALSYDMTYAIAYAIAATPDLAVSGKSVAQGLRTLGVGEPATVGTKDARSVVSQLASRKSVSLRGTFATMSWDFSGDIAAGTLDVWCVGTKEGAPTFGSSGLTMDVQTQVIGGAYVQCQ